MNVTTTIIIAANNSSNIYKFHVEIFSNNELRDSQQHHVISGPHTLVPASHLRCTVMGTSSRGLSNTHRLALGGP